MANDKARSKDDVVDGMDEAHEDEKEKKGEQSKVEAPSYIREWAERMKGSKRISG